MIALGRDNLLNTAEHATPNRAAAGGQTNLSIEAQLRIRDQLHALQVGLDLLRNEMLSGDFGGADFTYATLKHCLSQLSSDTLLANEISCLPGTDGGEVSDSEIAIDRICAQF